MNLKWAITLAMVASWADAYAQGPSDQELARWLANDSTRATAVTKILASTSSNRMMKNSI
jgi:hypothetical protein